MLLKTADDKTPDIEALEALLRRPDLDARTRRDVEGEIWSIRLGAKSEADAAYQLDFDLKESRHWVTIHDLRLDIEGQVAQIDHLVISRLLEVFVCESKSFTGGVKINDQGEWTTFRERRPIGIGSPIEQNRRHIAVLERAIKLGRVELPRRIVAIRPSFVNIVLVSKEGTISRPRRKLPDLDAVVKVDQFRTHLLNRNFSNLSMLKIVGSDTLATFGRQLVALHQPHQSDWEKRFGIPPIDPAAAAPNRERAPASKERKPSGIACASCGVEVSTAEAYYCRINKQRFDGQIYCIKCQQRIAPLRRT
jgi:hypothetical protein